MRGSISFDVLFACAMMIFGAGGCGYIIGHMAGADEIRAEVEKAADVCESVVRMGLKDWQAKVGVPLTQQVQCEPLRKIAEGRGQ